LNQKTSQLTMLGDLGKAQKTCQHSLDLARKSGNKSTIVSNLFYLGNIAKLEGRLENAHQTFSDALPLAREVGDSVTAMLEQGLAEVADEENHREEAKKKISEILSSLHDHQDPSDEGGAQSLLATIALEEGDTAAATRAINAARALLGQSQGWEGRCWFGIANARVQAAIGKLAEARESLKAVIKETRKHSNLRYQLEARLALCEIEAKTDPGSARAHAKTLEQEARSKGFGLIARKALAVGA
jgi:tetratricopeptide (TPR) repeat protein